MSNHEQISIDFADFMQKHVEFENKVEKDVKKIK